MKIEREPSDLSIENFIKDGVISGPISDTGTYSLNIKVTDPVKASNFLLIYSLQAKDSSKLEEICGFKITSINNFMAKDMSFVLDKLEEVMDFLSSNEVNKGITLE